MNDNEIRFSDAPPRPRKR